MNFSQFFLFLTTLAILSHQYGVDSVGVFSDQNIMKNDEMYRAFQIYHKIDKQIRRLEVEKRNFMKLEKEAKERSIIQTYLLPIVGKSSVMKDFFNRF